jgi:type II secretion system protein N
LRAILDFFLNILRYHKLKILLFVGLTLLFTVLLFPYGDLTSWMTVQVSKLTQQQVYVTSRDLGLSLLPHPGFKLKDVYIEAPQLPPLQAEALTFRPLPFGFPAGVVQAEGIAGGDATLKFSTKAGGTPEQLNKLEIKLDGVSLAQVAQLLPMGTNMEAKGAVRAMMDIAIPQKAPQNLSGDVTLTITNFATPSFFANTQMGPLEIPALSLSSLQTTVKMENGIVQLKEAQLGAPGDSVVGKVSGQITLGAGRGAAMIVSAYDLSLDLTFSDAFLSQPSVSLFTGLMDSMGDVGTRYKHPVSGGVRYAFRISANSPGAIPRFLPRGD